MSSLTAINIRIWIKQLGQKARALLTYFAALAIFIVFPVGTARTVYGTESMEAAMLLAGIWTIQLLIVIAAERYRGKL